MISLNLKYLRLKGTLVLFERYKKKNIITEINEDIIVAYAELETPNLKINMNKGFSAKFKMFEKIMTIVGVLEFPSTCNVSQKKFEKMNMNEHRHIGTKYNFIKSVCGVILINLSITSK